MFSTVVIGHALSIPEAGPSDSADVFLLRYQATHRATVALEYRGDEVSVHVVYGSVATLRLVGALFGHDTLGQKHVFAHAIPRVAPAWLRWVGQLPPSASSRTIPLVSSIPFRQASTFCGASAVSDDQALLASKQKRNFYHSGTSACVSDLPVSHFLSRAQSNPPWPASMASITSDSSTAGTVEAASMDGGKVLGSGSFNATDSKTHQPLAGSPPAGTDNDSGDSTAISTPLLVGIIAALVVIFIAVLFVIRSRRRRYKPKLSSPSYTSGFQRVASTKSLENSSDALGASGASTIVTSPQPPYMETFKLPRLSTKDASGDHIAIDVPEIHTPGNAGMTSWRDTQASRTTSLISGRSVFSASILMRGGLRSTLPSLASFWGSRTSGMHQTNEPQATDVSASTAEFARTVPTAPNSNAATAPPPLHEERHTDGGAWRDLSETCWSIGPGSDSETESERFSIAAASYPQAGALVLYPRRLSTLSDDIADIDEEGTLKDHEVNSLDDSSRRRDRVMSSLDDWSPRRERGISMLDDSSPRRVRGLSALDSRRKANSLADIVETNKSGGSYFSVDSDYYDETIKDCSSILFDDDDSDSDSSDSDDSLLEEEF
ncbi:hypothetical protein ON010_g11472 [Phytophthora cinnamomi]|nr:hypothetical protein ON010_g11472 [Phytophthora cinnamomi]